MEIVDHCRKPIVQRVVACLAIVVVTGWFWACRMLPDATEFRVLENADLFFYFYPMLEVGFAHLRAGELFLWNPHQMSGMPGLATMQAGYLYPLHFIYLFLPTAIGMGVSAVVHTLLAGIGALALCRVWGLGWIAAVAAGSYFALSSVFPLFGWPPGMEAQAWLPLGLLAIERIGLHDDRRAFPLLIAAVSMPFLAGGYQTSVGMYYCYALFMLGALVRRAAAERSVQEWLPGVITSFVLATAIGVLLVAPQLLSTLELSLLGERHASSLTFEQVIPIGHRLYSLSSLAQRLWVPAEPTIGLYTFLGLEARPRRRHFEASRSIG